MATDEYGNELSSPVLADELLLEFENGEARVLLAGMAMPVGSEFYLQRGGVWFRAWVIEVQDSVVPQIRIVDRRWPGAPVNLQVRDLSLISASRLPKGEFE